MNSLCILFKNKYPFPSYVYWKILETVNKTVLMSIPSTRVEVSKYHYPMQGARVPKTNVDSSSVHEQDDSYILLNQKARELSVTSGVMSTGLRS